ncbi:MAG: histidine phosphatase family protein [Oscillospiraceae bacterium]|nr:histidine phosphatase family protein [Oscillospiraceae bacterium]
MKNYYLYLIRHGITQGNLDGKYIGQTDLALCPEGKRVIESLCADEIYPEVQKVYSSPLARCLETAEIIYPDQKLMIIDEISEMNFGEFEGKTTEQLQDLREYTDWIKGGADSAPPNGEKYGDFSLRCIEGLDIIFKDMMRAEITRAACVTHAGVITNLLCGYGLPKGRPKDFMCAPGEGFEIVLSTFLWQKGPTFEISGRLTNNF